MARQRILPWLLAWAVRHAKPLSIFCYISAVALLLAMPLARRANYLDENALLAGSARSNMR